MAFSVVIRRVILIKLLDLVRTEVLSQHPTDNIGILRKNVIIIKLIDETRLYRVNKVYKRNIVLSQYEYVNSRES